MGEQREVIAHFSLAKLALGWVTWLACGVFLFLWARDVALAGFQTVPTEPTAHAVNGFGNFVHLWGLVVMTALLGLLVLWSFKLTRNIALNGSDAVWIERGRLFCRGPTAFDVALSDIKSAELASQVYTVNTLFFPRKELHYISILLKNGTQAKLYPGGYRETEDEVLAPIIAAIRTGHG